MGDPIIDPEVEQAVKEKIRPLQKDIDNLKAIFEQCICAKCEKRLSCEVIR